MLKQYTFNIHIRFVHFKQILELLFFIIVNKSIQLLCLFYYNLKYLMSKRNESHLSDKLKHMTPTLYVKF